ncbi:MAG TPA: hypothetical protein VG273_10920, partial [Bryobacteraceae bacterium]|nr:hypothetical protein [Bryobacteraceae bacterium]
MELNIHGTDDELENYALGRLPEPDSSDLEDHLMLCESCRTRLDYIENFALGMRRALHEAPAPPEFSWKEFCLGLFKKPTFALAFCAVALLALLAVYAGRSQKTLPVASLQLIAL